MASISSEFTTSCSEVLVRPPLLLPVRSHRNTPRLSHVQSSDFLIFVWLPCWAAPSSSSAGRCTASTLDIFSETPSLYVVFNLLLESPTIFGFMPDVLVEITVLLLVQVFPRLTHRVWLFEKIFALTLPKNCARFSVERGVDLL